MPLHFAVVVALVRFPVADSLAGVLDDFRPFADVTRGEDTATVDW